MSNRDFSFDAFFSQSSSALDSAARGRGALRRGDCIRPWWMQVSAAVLAGGLLVSPSVSAQTIRYTSTNTATPNKWSTASNWGSGSVPGANADRLVLGLEDSGILDLEDGTIQIGMIQVSAPPIGPARVTIQSTPAIAPLGGSLTVGSVEVDGNATLVFDGGPTAPVAINAIGPVGSKTLDVNRFGGSGTVEFNGGVTADKVHLHAGVLGVNAAGGLGTGDVVVSGGELKVTGPNSVGRDLVINGGKVSGNADLSVAGVIRASQGVVEFSPGGLSGAAGLEKTGEGTLYLKSANSYTGATVIKSGNVVIKDAGAFGTGQVTVESGAVRVDESSVGSLAVLNAVTISGNVTLSGNSSGRDLQLDGGVDLAGGMRQINVENGVQLKDILVGTGGFVKKGAGQLTLAGLGGFTGGVTIAEGVVNVVNPDGLGAGDVNVVGGALTVSVSSTIQGALKINGGVVDASAAPLTVNGTAAQLPVQATAGTVKGGIAGGAAGAVFLQKTGEGALRMTGANTFSGNTEIHAGVVEFDDSSSFGTGNINLKGGTMKVVAPAVVGPAVSLTQSVAAQSGNSAIDASAYGPLSVGDLTVGDATLPAPPAASLAVRGIVKAPFGPLAVNPTGTIVFDVDSRVEAKDVKFEPGSKIEVTPALFTRVARSVAATGVATTIPNSTIIKDTMVPPLIADVPSGSVYRSAAVNVSAFSDASTGGVVALKATRSAYREVAQSPTSRSFGAAVDRLLGDHLGRPGDQVAELIDKLDAIASADELTRMFDRVNPGAAYASLYTVGVKRSLAVSASLDAHLENIAAASGGEGSVSFGVRPAMLTPGNNTAAAKDYSWTAWTAGYGTRSSIDADASAGIGKTTMDDHGASLGVERQFGNLRVGLLTALGESDTDFEPNVRAKSDHWNIGGYGSVAFGSVTVDATAMWGEADNKANRESLGGPVSAKFNSTDTQLGVGLAVNLTDPNSEWQITPVARLKYINYSQDAFSESGTGLKFDTDKLNESTVVSKLGLRVGRRGIAAKSVALGLDGGAYWVHDYNADGKPVGMRLSGVSNSTYTAVGRKADADVAQFNLGVQATFSDALTLRLSGQQEVGGNRSQSTGILSFAVNF